MAGQRRRARWRLVGGMTKTDGRGGAAFYSAVLAVRCSFLAWRAFVTRGGVNMTRLNHARTRRARDGDATVTLGQCILLCQPLTMFMAFVFSLPSCIAAFRGANNGAVPCRTAFSLTCLQRLLYFPVRRVTPLQAWVWRLARAWRRRAATARHSGIGRGFGMKVVLDVARGGGARRCRDACAARLVRAPARAPYLPPADVAARARLFRGARGRRCVVAAAYSGVGVAGGVT